MSCESLISRVFYDRNHAHVTHWQTTSYAQHVALADFYEGVIGILDRFVETYRGLGNEIKNPPEHEATGSILKCLSDNAKWIASNREKISEGVEALENILDELVGLYLTTIYKLKVLK